jgi:hypothetical protein
MQKFYTKPSAFSRQHSAVSIQPIRFSQSWSGNNDKEQATKHAVENTPQHFTMMKCQKHASVDYS